MMDSLLVGVSGSVAVLNLPSYLATLRAELAREVRVIMTAAGGLHAATFYRRPGLR